jgi:hypothetical protein
MAEWNREDRNTVLEKMGKKSLETLRNTYSDVPTTRDINKKQDSQAKKIRLRRQILDIQTARQQKQKAQTLVKASTLQQINPAIIVQAQASSVTNPHALVTTLDGDKVKAGSQPKDSTIVAHVGQLDPKATVAQVQPTLTAAQVHGHVKVNANVGSVQQGSTNVMNPVSGQRQAAHTFAPGATIQTTGGNLLHDASILPVQTSFKIRDLNDDVLVLVHASELKAADENTPIIVPAKYVKDSAKYVKLDDENVLTKSAQAFDNDQEVETIVKHIRDKTCGLIKACDHPNQAAPVTPVKKDDEVVPATDPAQQAARKLAQQQAAQKQEAARKAAQQQTARKRAAQKPIQQQRVQTSNSKLITALVSEIKPGSSVSARKEDIADQTTKVITTKDGIVMTQEASKKPQQVAALAQQVGMSQQAQKKRIQQLAQKNRIQKQQAQKKTNANLFGL